MSPAQDFPHCVLPLFMLCSFLGGHDKKYIYITHSKTSLTLEGFIVLLCDFAPCDWNYTSTI